MLADVAERLYTEGDYNCAEAVLLAANEVYGFGLDPRTAHRMVSAFGGGMGCGQLCGAVAGAMAALGLAKVEGRAHTTEGFRDLCADTTAKLREALGGLDCAQLKPIYSKTEKRCAVTVRIACDVLEKQLGAPRG